MKVPTRKRRLYIDLETSPNIGFFWEAGYKKNIPYENIIHERAIICACFKWDGERKVSSLIWDKGNDKKLLKELIKILGESTEIVAHNGDAFDLKWIRTRALKHGFEMAPSYVTVDTLKAARSRFRFNSNRLDYLAKFLGMGGKLKTGFDLWKAIVLNNCEASMNKMVRYCKEDVRILERVYDKLKNHIPSKVHYGNDKVDCPECGGETRISKTWKSAAGIKRVQRLCKNCGKYHTTNK